MNLTIRRGTNEIGGSCIELQSGNSRIVLDFGMPLLNANGKAFNFREFEKLSKSQNNIPAKGYMHSVTDGDMISTEEIFKVSK